jgi:hypothetical protein
MDQTLIGIFIYGEICFAGKFSSKVADLLSVQRHGSIVISAESQEAAASLVPVAASVTPDVRLIETGNGEFLRATSRPSSVALCSIETLKADVLSLQTISEGCRGHTFIICGTYGTLRGAAVSSICSELSGWSSDIICICIGPIICELSRGNLKAEFAALLHSTRCTTDDVVPSKNIEPTRKAVFVCHGRCTVSTSPFSAANNLDLELNFNSKMKKAVTELLAIRSRVREDAEVSKCFPCN